MIEGLKPYAESAKTKPMTRTSQINIPWLTATPEHWKVVRSKGLFTTRTERARSDDEQLSATQAYGVIPQKEFENRVGRKVVRITQHLEKRAHVEPDDFVISMRSFQGGLERAWARGCIRSSYVVLKPSPKTHVGYFAHLFKSLDYVRALQATANFIRDGQDLNFNNFSLVDLPLPPLDEQAAIAKCLDHANRKIDGFIRAKRKLIGLLNEQKQAIIHRAVTRGLDPDVPLKPSGVPWLGDIPAHWEVRRIGRFAKVGNGSTPSRGNTTYWHGGSYPWLNSSQVNRGLIDCSDQFVTREALRECHLPKVEAGSVLVAITGQGKTRGMSAILAVEATINQHIAYITARPSIISTDFLHITLAAAYSTLRALSEDSGSTKGALTCEDLKRFSLPIPPHDEQKELVDVLNRETSTANAAITRTEREIALMQEYRTRLTADIVTGKLDVREAAARLPEVSADEEAAAGLEEMDEDGLDAEGAEA